MSKVRLLVEIDIEHPPSNCMLRRYVERGVKRALGLKKLNHGAVNVWTRNLDDIDEATISFIDVLRQHIIDEADRRIEDTVRNHKDGDH